MNPNPVVWLAIYTWAGKMSIYCPLGISLLWSYIQGKCSVGYNKSFINQAYLVKMIWLSMNLLASFFFAFISTLNLSWSIKQRKQKTLANIQPYILTSHMVDNAYLFSCKMLFGDGIISYWERCCGMSPGQTINQALNKTGYFTQAGIKTSQKTCSLKN